MRDSYDPRKINAVVLLTDGVNDDGDHERRRRPARRAHPARCSGSEGANAKPVRVFTIAYGEDADTADAAADRRGHQRRAVRRQQPGHDQRGVHRRGLQLLSRMASAGPACVPSFRDRFFTPPVARAMTVAARDRAGRRGRRGRPRRRAAASSAPSASAAVAWGGRVAAAIPRGDKRRTASTRSRCRSRGGATCRASLAAQARFDRTVEATPTGPLRDHLADSAPAWTQGIEEVWQIACRGDDIDGGLDARSTSARPQAELARLDQDRRPARHTAATREALEAQLATGGADAGRVDRRPRPPPPARRPPRRAGGPGRRAVGQRQRVGDHRAGRRRRRPRHRDGVAPPGARGGGSGRRRDARPARPRRGPARDRPRP